MCEKYYFSGPRNTKEGGRLCPSLQRYDRVWEYVFRINHIPGGGTQRTGVGWLVFVFPLPPGELTPPGGAYEKVGGLHTYT